MEKEVVDVKKGFTLIELLVVVLIIGILAAIALPQYERAVLKARVATILPVIKSVHEAQEVYYLSHGTYATAASDLDIELPASCTWLSNPWDSAGRNMFTCGKYFVLDVKSGMVTNAGSAVSYCPEYVTNWPNCYNNRSFVVIHKFTHATDYADKRYCCPQNSSAFGTQACKSITGKTSPDEGSNYYF